MLLLFIDGIQMSGPLFVWSHAKTTVFNAGE
jgi:hypothetical protein